MEQQYIEREGRQLYSVYHAPKNSCDRGAGIVLCNPLGQEYIRCHRTMVNLGEKLSQAGWHVLRFDYYGTGDAAGGFDEVNIPGCIRDIKNAAAELMEICDLPAVALAGIRTGATLAYLAAGSMPADALVMWSPVCDGPAYLHECRQLYRTWLHGSFAKETITEDGAVHSFGYRFSPALTEQLTALSLTQEPPPRRRTLLIGEAAGTLFSGTEKVTLLPETNHRFWQKQDNDADKAVVPANEIQQITAWLGQI